MEKYSDLYSLSTQSYQAIPMLHVLVSETIKFVLSGINTTRIFLNKFPKYMRVCSFVYRI